MLSCHVVQVCINIVINIILCVRVCVWGGFPLLPQINQVG